MALGGAVKFWPAGEGGGTLKKEVRKLSKAQDRPTTDPESTLENDDTLTTPTGSTLVAYVVFSLFGDEQKFKN
jgi:hypothetical protein